MPPPDSSHRLLDAALQAAARLEQQLHTARKLEAAGLLAAGVAHDFNNLLTVIEGYSEVLLTTHELPAQSRELIQGIREASRHAAALTRTLLAFGRTVPHEPRIIDLNHPVRELTALVKRLLPPQIRLTTAAQPGLNPVRADPAAIQHALLNLLFNSRDAMPQGGLIEIRTANLTVDAATAPLHPGTPEGNYVLLAVQDTGGGMDEETRRRIFEPFYTSKPEGAGTGLGLPMVQSIVQQNHGFLAVESQPGQGATVRIYLPCCAEEEAPPPAAAPPPQVPARGHGTVLVAEEAYEMRRFLRSILESLGYSVLEAPSAWEAAALGDSFAGAIDLLVTSTAPADSSGLDLARRLREIRPGLPVLYISGHTGETPSPENMPPPEVELLRKPFAVSEFAQRVRDLLHSQKPRRILFVDDDATLALFAFRVLREAGFEVLVAGNWRVALHTVQTEHPDLLITDLAIPAHGGPDTILTLRKSHPTLPLIATSEAGGPFLKTAASLGAFATLAKPFTAEQLLETVRRALERDASRQASTQ